MTPRFGARAAALVVVLVLLASSWLAPRASAQTSTIYDAARQTLDLSLDPLARSPRLLGLGRLTLVGDDPHNRLTMWDFAGNPTGIAEADTGSTFELRPATSSASAVRDRLLIGGERQDLAARETRFGYEGWRRTGSTAYGAIGEFATLRMDQPFSASVEQRSSLTLPTAMPVLTGKLPYAPDAWRFALRLFYSGETEDDEFRLFSYNNSGEYIDQDGSVTAPPNLFTPKEVDVQTLGGGAAVSWRVGPWLTAAVGADLLDHKIEGANNGARHASEITERRPVRLGQVSLIGRVGPGIEWGVDGRGWTSDSEQRWAFTISAGTSEEPFSGRGKMLEREEEGSRLRTRVRWTSGPLEIGAGAGTRYRKVTVTPPELGDLTSFNAFRTRVSQRAGTDSLVLPDSVIANESAERGWEAGVGAALHVLDGRGLWGAELHSDRIQLDQSITGLGPRRVGWDARTGFEYRITNALQGRAGYRYRHDDRDDRTEQNEFVGHTLTLGGGLHPIGARWSLESGYSVEWLQADFGDPGAPRSSRQQLAATIRWAF